MVFTGIVEEIGKICISETVLLSMGRTNLEQLKEASPVNLERALSAQGRFGGHIVQGHVDGVGTIRSMYPEGDSLWFWVDTTREIAAFVVEKGYIAVDGTSLTVCATQDCSFQFMLVAYTQQHVILPQKQVGDQVNLEVDILGKYVKQFIKQD
ncbi:Riboflavin synthase [Galdieria sulphuraria]|nr:Riboflavin synthase [Galdieria sulphuraria]